MPGKVFKVTITLPDLVAAHAEQSTKVESNNRPMAMKLACDEISKRPHVLGKHIRSAKIFFNLVDSPSNTVPNKKPEIESLNDKEVNQGTLFEL